MLKKILALLLFVPVCYAQQQPPKSQYDLWMEQYIVKKDKNGKPLPVCAPDQKSTEDKPCRQMTNSQRAGAGGRS